MSSAICTTQKWRKGQRRNSPSGPRPHRQRHLRLPISVWRATCKNRGIAATCQEGERDQAGERGVVQVTQECAAEKPGNAVRGVEPSVRRAPSFGRNERRDGRRRIDS